MPGEGADPLIAAARAAGTDPGFCAGERRAGPSAGERGADPSAGERRAGPSAGERGADPSTGARSTGGRARAVRRRTARARPRALDSRTRSAQVWPPAGTARRTPPDLPETTMTTRPCLSAAALAAVLLLGAVPAGAQGAADHPALGLDPLLSAAEMGAGINRITDDMGEMVADIELVLSRGPAGTADVSPEALDDALRFQPFGLVGELARDDLVLLMRHGPTDWSMRDVKDVLPGDCANQRVMTPLGEERMRSMGILMAGNGLRPGKVIASEWCRNQQTLARVREGFALVDPAYAEAVPVETSADLNLLLSLQGTPDVTAMRAAILAWDGPAARRPEGPPPDDQPLHQHRRADRFSRLRGRGPDRGSAPRRPRPGHPAPALRRPRRGALPARRDRDQRRRRRRAGGGRVIRPALLALLLAVPALAQEPSPPEPAPPGTARVDPAAMGAAVRQLSAHEGEMVMDLELVMRSAPDPVPEAAPEAMRESLRFEPFQIADEIFDDDLVFVMRAGPADWSAPVAADAPGCAAQRALTPLGRERMRAMGVLMAGNGLRPGRIATSETCRAGATADMLREGFALIDPDASAIPAERLAAAGPVGLDPAADVAALHARLMAWDGPGEGDAAGPLLVITHFDTIEALTSFQAYEGEILIFDPDRTGRILGYIRLRSAAPDAGRFGARIDE